MGATAGLRLLPDGKADLILAEVRTWLRKHPFQVGRLRGRWPPVVLRELSCTPGGKTCQRGLPVMLEKLCCRWPMAAAGAHRLPPPAPPPPNCPVPS